MAFSAPKISDLDPLDDSYDESYETCLATLEVSVLAMRTLFKKHCVAPVARGRSTRSKSSNGSYSPALAPPATNFALSWLKQKIIDKAPENADYLMEFVDIFNSFSNVKDSDINFVAKEILDTLMRKKDLKLSTIEQLSVKMCKLLEDQSYVIGDRKTPSAHTPIISSVPSSTSESGIDDEPKSGASESGITTAIPPKSSSLLRAYSPISDADEPSERAINMKHAVKSGSAPPGENIFDKFPATQSHVDGKWQYRTGEPVFPDRNISPRVCIARLGGENGAEENNPTQKSTSGMEQKPSGTKEILPLTVESNSPSMSSSASFAKAPSKCDVKNVIVELPKLSINQQVDEIIPARPGPDPKATKSSHVNKSEEPGASVEPCVATSGKETDTEIVSNPSAPRKKGKSGFNFRKATIKHTTTLVNRLLKNVVDSVVSSLEGTDNGSGVETDIPESDSQSSPVAPVRKRRRRTKQEIAIARGQKKQKVRQAIAANSLPSGYRGKLRKEPKKVEHIQVTTPKTRGRRKGSAAIAPGEPIPKMNKPDTDHQIMSPDYVPSSVTSQESNELGFENDLLRGVVSPELPTPEDSCSSFDGPAVVKGRKLPQPARSNGASASAGLQSQFRGMSESELQNAVQSICPGTPGRPQAPVAGKTARMHHLPTQEPHHGTSSSSADNTNQEFACLQCDRVYSTRKDLRQHETAYHSAEYVCCTCDKLFQTKTHLNLHLKSATHAHGVEVEERFLQFIVRKISIEDGTVNPDVPLPLSCRKGVVAEEDHNLTHPAFQAAIRHIKRALDAASRVAGGIPVGGTVEQTQPHVSPPIWEVSGTQNLSYTPAQLVENGHPRLPVAPFPASGTSSTTVRASGYPSHPTPPSGNNQYSWNRSGADYMPYGGYSGSQTNYLKNSPQYHGGPSPGYSYASPYRPAPGSSHGQVESPALTYEPSTIHRQNRHHSVCTDSPASASGYYPPHPAASGSQHVGYQQHAHQGSGPMVPLVPTYWNPEPEGHQPNPHPQLNPNLLPQQLAPTAYPADIHPVMPSPVSEEIQYESAPQFCSL